MATITWGQGWPYNGQCPADSGGYTDNGHVPRRMCSYGHGPDYALPPAPRQPDGEVILMKMTTILTTIHCRPIFPQPIIILLPSPTITTNTIRKLQHPKPPPSPIMQRSALRWISPPTGSSASVTDAIDALKTYFKYHEGMYRAERANYSDTEWKTMVKAELDAGRPLIYSGNHPTSGAGHAFICDGYANDGSTDYFSFQLGMGRLAQR